MSPAPRPQILPSCDLAAPRVVGPALRLLDGHDVHVAVQVQRAAAAGSGEAAPDAGAALVGKDGEAAARVGRRLGAVGLDALDREAETPQPLLDDLLRSFLVPEQAPLARRGAPSGSMQVVETFVDGVADRGEHRHDDTEKREGPGREPGPSRGGVEAARGRA